MGLVSKYPGQDWARPFALAVTEKKRNGTVKNQKRKSIESSPNLSTWKKNKKKNNKKDKEPECFLDWDERIYSNRPLVLCVLSSLVILRLSYGCEWGKQKGEMK